MAGNILLIVCAGLGVLVVLRWPSSPIVVGYPLIWLFWNYQVPFLGGSIERLVALLGLLGVAILLSRHIPLSLPQSAIQVGSFLLIIGQLASALVNSSSNFVEVLISLITRVLFMYMAYLLIRTQKQLRWMIILYIFMGIIGAIAAVAANMVYGLGFFRTTAWLAIQQDIPPLLQEIILNAQFGIISAWLLLGVFPTVRNPIHRVSILALILFIFGGSFIAQFRREYLFAIPVVLFFLFLYRPARVQREAFFLLLIAMGIFTFILLPGSIILQGRLNETSRLLTGTDTRLMSLKTAWEMFKDHPILGWVGFLYEYISPLPGVNF